jgi:hypothetical protein
VALQKEKEKKEKKKEDNVRRTGASLKRKRKSASFPSDS